MTGKTPHASTFPRFRKSGRWVLLVLLLIMVGCGIAAWRWYNKPIVPVVLEPGERAVVEAKLGMIQQPVVSSDRPEPVYEKGAREIVFTEREINGLLNQRTTLGKTVYLELVPQAIHARVETHLDPAVPLVGGKRLKARARLLAGEVSGQKTLVLDDVTVWGISLPNEWLGQMKGKNLLGEVLGAGGTGIPGVKDFQLKNGEIVIQLAE